MVRFSGQNSGLASLSEQPEASPYAAPSSVRHVTQPSNPSHPLQNKPVDPVQGTTAADREEDVEDEEDEFEYSLNIDDKYEDRNFSFGTLSTSRTPPSILSEHAAQQQEAIVSSPQASPKTPPSSVENIVPRIHTSSSGNGKSIPRAKSGGSSGAKVCIICKNSRGNFGKNYSTRRSVEDYMKFFPGYDGTPGRVCQHCYNQMYTLRRKELEKKNSKKGRKSKRRGVSAVESAEVEELTPSSSTSSIAEDEESNEQFQFAEQVDQATNSSKGIGGGDESKNEEEALSLPESTIAEPQTTPCACCHNEMGENVRSYKYSTFAKEYRELFPDSAGASEDSRVCHFCYRKCLKLREDREAAERKRRRATVVNNSGTPSASTSSPSKRAKVTARDSNHQFSTDKSPVELFLEFRFRKEDSEVQTRSPVVIRVFTDPVVSVSTLNSMIEDHLNQILPDSPTRISGVRRVLRDFNGSLLEESLFQERILEKFPLLPKQRLVVDVTEPKSFRCDKQSTN